MENVESGTVVLSHRVRDAVCVPLPSATPGIFERAIETMIRVPLLPSFPWHTLGSMEIRSLQSNSIMIFPPVSGKADLPLQGCTDRVNAISSIIPLSAKLKTKSSPMITLSSTFTQWASMQQKVFCEKPVRFACLRCPGWMIVGYNHPGGIEGKARATIRRIGGLTGRTGQHHHPPVCGWHGRVSKSFPVRLGGHKL